METVIITISSEVGEGVEAKVKVKEGPGGKERERAATMAVLLQTFLTIGTELCHAYPFDKLWCLRRDARLVEKLIPGAVPSHGGPIKAITHWNNNGQHSIFTGSSDSTAKVRVSMRENLLQH
jgi:hypothetical protein